jgi:hypothetical protein
VVHGALALEEADGLGDLGGLLADGDVDADEVATPLVEDGVDGDGGLAGGTVADTPLRVTTLGAMRSMGRVLSELIGPLPSIGWPRASTTRPRRPSPTGTSAMRPVVLTCWPSWMSM